jgi:ribosomal protein L33
MTNYYESINRSLTPIKLEINRLKEKQINHTLFLTNAKLIFKVTLEVDKL